jgi:hypothetical protein
MEKKNAKKDEQLDALMKLEQTAKGIEPEETIDESDRDVVDNSPENEPTVIDGYRIVDRSTMPFEGRLYPPTWKFAYKCPTTKQVANFSTVNEADQAAIMNAVEELVKDCFVILDTITGAQVSNNELNDGDRMYFFLLLREFYLHDKPIEYTVMSQNQNEPVLIKLVAASLRYPDFNPGVFKCFDGRIFTIPVAGMENPIVFRVPTFGASGKIFRHIIQKYRESQSANEEQSRKMKDDETFNKNFLLLAPFLFVNGNESIEALKLKFRGIFGNEELLKHYLTVINKMPFQNLEKIEYTYKGAIEEALVRFPGGWKNMFINSSAFGDLFN